MAKSPKSNAGRPRVFVTPDDLYQEFLRYVEFQKANPIPKTHFVGKDGEERIEFIQRPITWLGFEGYLAQNNLLKDLRIYEKLEEFSPTVSQAKAFCKWHNVDLASAGQLKENIIARIEGINETQNVNIQQEQPLFPDVQANNGNK